MALRQRKNDQSGSGAPGNRQPVAGGKRTSPRGRIARIGVWGFGGLAIAAVSGATLAFAAEWRLIPRIDVEEVFSDNVDLARKGQEKSDFITTISPGIGIRGDTSRINLSLDYNPVQLIYLDDSDRNQFRHRLLGTGQVELIERMFFIDADASISQQFINNRDAVAGSDVTASRNLRTVQTYGIGPVLRNRFSDYAESELSYRFGAVVADSSQVADTTTHTLSALINSGSYFGRFGWALAGEDSRTRRSGSPTAFGGLDSDHRYGKADGEYAVSERFSLLGGIGYEDIDDPTVLRSSDGLVWDVGFSFRPSRTASLRVTFGERYNASNTNVDAAYQIGERTNIRAGYSQTLETSQSLLGSNLNLLSVNEFGQLVNTNTGQLFTPGDPAFGLDSAAFRRDRFSFGIRSSHGRSTYGAEVFHEDREFDINNQTETAFGGQINWSRQLTRNTDVDLSLIYRRTEFDQLQSRRDDYYNVNLGFTRRVSDTLNARLSFSHTTRNSTIDLNDLDQNVVVLGIGKSF